MPRRPSSPASSEPVVTPVPITVVVRLGGPLMSQAGGATEFTVEALTIRDMLRCLGDRYPELRPILAKGVTVAVNGAILRASWLEPIPAGAEVYLLPPMQGG
jgi:sulfur-carrier protein